MNVTQHARFTALFRLFEQSGVVGIHDRLPFHRLEQEWNRLCGLRRNDLLFTLDELIVVGGVKRLQTGDGPVIELTDRGLFRMQSWLKPFATFSWRAPLSSLSEQLNTRHVLAKARQRSRGSKAKTAKRHSREGDRGSMV